MSLSRPLLLQLESPPGTLAERIRVGALEYGDPPNVDCCPAGPTMNSVPKRVLEYWRWGGPSKDPAVRAWKRDPSLEVELRCLWWEDDDEGLDASDPGLPPDA